MDQEWAALTDAVSSFLERVHEEEQRLDQETHQTLQATADTQQAVATGSAEAHSEVAEGRAHLDALAQYTAGLHASVESLTTEGGETPAHGLAQRATQIEQELVHALEEARDFVHNDVVHGIAETAHDIRDRCHALRSTLADEYTHALRAAFDHWESKVDELEEYVSKQGFKATQQHAHDVVEYAVTECKTAFAQQLERLDEIVERLVDQVQELAVEMQRSGEAVLARTGTNLVGGLDGTRDAVTNALSALATVRDLLVSYSFVAI